MRMDNLKIPRSHVDGGILINSPFCSLDTSWFFLTCLILSFMHNFIIPWNFCYLVSTCYATDCNYAVVVFCTYKLNSTITHHHLQIITPFWSTDLIKYQVLSIRKDKFCPDSYTKNVFKHTCLAVFEEHLRIFLYGSASM